ncbi:MAG: response regulator [Thermodesulfobacteriota bacterium]
MLTKKEHRGRTVAAPAGLPEHGRGAQPMLTIVNSSTHAGGRKHALRILVVEDDEMSLELTTDLLESAGYEVSAARTAEEALEKARTGRPDLILMDICLPGMDGLTATKRLKEEPETTGIPVVALTAHAMKGDESKAYAAGCAGYLSKPFSTRFFLDVVAEFVANPDTWASHAKGVRSGG